MPIIYIDGPVLSKEKKAELVKDLTEAASKVMNIPKQAFTVVLRETSPDNVGVGGELLSERQKQ